MWWLENYWYGGLLWQNVGSNSNVESRSIQRKNQFWITCITLTSLIKLVGWLHRGHVHHHNKLLATNLTDKRLATTLLSIINKKIVLLIYSFRIYLSIFKVEFIKNQFDYKSSLSHIISLAWFCIYNEILSEYCYK